MIINSQKAIIKMLNEGCKIQTYTPAHFGARTLYYTTKDKVEYTIASHVIKSLFNKGLIDENDDYVPNCL